MTIRILYFSWIREKIGTGEEHMELPANVKTIADLIKWLRTLSPVYDEAFSELVQIRAAIDQNHVSLDVEIGLAGEIAFFPPVTGG